MHLGNAEAANTVTNFMGTSFMLCLFGGYVADTYLGRYLTIAIFSAIQALVRPFLLLICNEKVVNIVVLYYQ